MCSRFRRQAVDQIVRSKTTRQSSSVWLRATAGPNGSRSKRAVVRPTWPKNWRPRATCRCSWLTDEAKLSDSDRWVREDHLSELQSLGERIKAVEKRITAATADDPVVAQLLAQPNVGLVTAATLRAEVGRFDRFDTGKQLARFCGVTPRNASSGARQADAGLIKACNPDLRKVLIELSHWIIRTKDPQWSQLAAEMLGRGKPKNVVVAAVANRWVRWLHHELRRDKQSESTSTPAQQKGLTGRPRKIKRNIGLRWGGALDERWGPGKPGLDIR